MKYYLHKGGQQFGPYSREALISFMEAGELAATDPAWAEDRAGWETVADVLKDMPEISKGSATPPAKLAPAGGAPGNPQATRSPAPAPAARSPLSPAPARGLQAAPAPLPAVQVA
ncbi:MAG TPA: DUF4339 domain-containing protein, partial [Candidatus Methylacidiphilales bacterium]|nr:DUF4339 domain-containing protein [Candidatus Methylacidiphilales bacterium]